MCRYRSFPTITLPAHELELPRQYACNFIGTMYKNSTREILVDVLMQSGLVDSGRCFLKTRKQYVMCVCCNYNLYLHRRIEVMFSGLSLCLSVQRPSDLILAEIQFTIQIHELFKGCITDCIKSALFTRWQH